MRRTLPTALMTAFATLSLALLVPLSAEAAPASAVFTKTQDWGSGFGGSVAVTNSTTAPLTWNVQFDVPAGFSIPSAWDAVMSRSGQHYTFTAPSWAGPLAPGAATSFGFNGNPGNFPGILNCTLNGQPCGGGGPQPGVPSAPGTPTVTATDTSLTLSWSAATGTVLGYRVYEGTTVRVTGPGTTATFGGLAACTSRTYTVRAFNDVGEGPASPPVTGTTNGCATGPLPKHFLTGYWHNFVNQATELKLADTPADYDLVAVAFGEATTTPGQVRFAVDPGLSTALGGYTDAQLKADIATLHRRGSKVILSVGGETGNVRVTSPAEATAFADSVHALMTSFGFDGVDIDLENGLDATNMADALRKLRAKAGANLIITMAPQTIDMQSTAGSYFKLALAIKDILTVVHTQFYNSGAMLGCDNGVHSQGSVNFIVALACVQLENGLRPDQVALGLPAGPGAAGGGVVSPSIVNQALDCLATGTRCGTVRPPRTYPGIRGAMTWSVNWDASHGNNFSRTVKPHLLTLP